MMSAARLRWCEVAAKAGVAEQSVRELAADVEGPAPAVRLSTLLRVSAALGCAPAEIVPVLAARPRSGLLWERGVFSEAGLKG
jgi:DNA-binding Xre family transcriptional regulator